MVRQDQLILLRSLPTSRQETLSAYASTKRKDRRAGDRKDDVPDDVPSDVTYSVTLGCHPWGTERMNSETGSIVLTYAELAQRLAIKPASAKRLAQRRKWVRVVGNDGVARVHVPLAAVPGDVPDDVASNVPDDVIPAVSPPGTPKLISHIAYLDGIIEGLKGQLEAEQRRADAAESRTKDIAADRDNWRQQAQRSLWSRLFGGPEGR